MWTENSPLDLEKWRSLRTLTRIVWDMDKIVDSGVEIQLHARERIGLRNIALSEKSHSRLLCFFKNLKQNHTLQCLRIHIYMW